MSKKHEFIPHNCVLLPCHRDWWNIAQADKMRNNTIHHEHGVIWLRWRQYAGNVHGKSEQMS